MSEQHSAKDGHQVAFEAFGVRALVSAPDEATIDRVKLLLPPGWQPCQASTAEKHFAIVDDEHGRFEFYRDTTEVARGLTVEHALTLFEAQVREYVALHAPDYIFVHAGAVAYGDKAIVIPGMSFTGKTTMVAALVKAGALYYSDEFAVLDAEGFVHPYGKPLSLRDGKLEQVDHEVEALGGARGEGRLRIGAIVVTSYRPGAEWQPRRGSAGQGAMALLANTVAAQERPPEVMRALTRAADGAIVVESERGEADALAPRLLAELNGST